jgi:class 3 adenylate cyclase/CheY-like chemotaxis protein
MIEQLHPKQSNADSRILIVDDHATNRMKLSMAIFHLGHEVELAEDGVQALEVLRSREIDLVLLDILMPQMDGTTVLLHMQSDMNLRDIPVIVISAVDEMDSVVACIERGAEDYLPKDFDPVLLEARVNACLEKKKLRDAVVSQLNFIQDIFGKYVPESVVKTIMETGGLKPSRTDATILFTDIEGFTTIVEKLSPEQAFTMLNEYFPAIIEPIHQFGGVINQFQGDAMLVTFNVPVTDPDHADNAVRVAREILKICHTKKFAGTQLRTRVGINTGEVVSGNIGSGARINYTVHGDAVNVAARLEQLNKQHGTLGLVSGSTLEQLKDSYNFRSLGETEIRGKKSAVQINELIVS